MEIKVIVVTIIIITMIIAMAILTKNKNILITTIRILTMAANNFVIVTL